eukprot:jgi/Botrbrau1/19713/Bobra.0003s0073.1
MLATFNMLLVATGQLVLVLRCLRPCMAPLGIIQWDACKGLPVGQHRYTKLGYVSYILEPDESAVLYLEKYVATQVCKSESCGLGWIRHMGRVSCPCKAPWTHSLG